MPRSRVRHDASLRGHRDDMAPAPLAHERKHSASQGQGAEKVGFEHAPHRRVFALFHSSHVAITGVVDQHINVTERAEGIRHGGGNGAGVGNIQRQCHRLLRPRTDQVGDRLRATRSDRYPGTTFQRSAGDFPAKAAGAAGNQPDRILQCGSHLSSNHQTSFATHRTRGMVYRPRVHTFGAKPDKSLPPFCLWA